MTMEDEAPERGALRGRVRKGSPPENKPALLRQSRSRDKNREPPLPTKGMGLALPR